MFCALLNTADLFTNTFDRVPPSLDEATRDNYSLLSQSWSTRVNNVAEPLVILSESLVAYLRGIASPQSSLISPLILSLQLCQLAEAGRYTLVYTTARSKRALKVSHLAYCDDVQTFGSSPQMTKEQERVIRVHGQKIGLSGSQ